jgi:hypothetical protein
MDIHKAIQHLKGELRHLNRIIQAVEAIAATYGEKLDPVDVVVESPTTPPENLEPASETCLHLTHPSARSL